MSHLSLFRALLLCILAGAFDVGGFLFSVSVHFYKVSLLFLLFFPLYSFLQAGRFTTKRQRESPINLVANHALDSSVDLCLCPSVCICSFLFSPSHSFPCSVHLTCLSVLYQPSFIFFLCYRVVLLSYLPHKAHVAPSFCILVIPHQLPASSTPMIYMT